MGIQEIHSSFALNSTEMVKSKLNMVIKYKITLLRSYLLNFFLIIVKPITLPCNPSPCGPNSRCIVSHQGYSTCSCIPGFRGTPPLCIPECVVSSDCLQMHACINNKCVNPCKGVCGHNALCSVINHNPVCSCHGGQDGDPFIQCFKPPGM